MPFGLIFGEQVRMSLRLGLVSLQESRRCLLSPATISIAVILFAINVANLARATTRLDAAKERTGPRRMAVHCASLLAFATIGTAASMSALPVAVAEGFPSSLKPLVGSLNGASMCFVFYAASTASAVARLFPPDLRSSDRGRLLPARTRAFNAWLFAVGLPLFIATSLVAFRLGGAASATGAAHSLLLSMAVPLTMGSALFIRADRRLASLQNGARKEISR
jgi:hypothetical protein